MILYFPFVVQSIAITFDEFYFHWKRGLPKWERLGHPIDTLSLLSCILFVMFLPYSSKNLIIYCILAIFSCLCVTKDEWIHKEHCDGKEQWLHALLFLNHPLVLLALGLMWVQKESYFTFFLFQNIFVALFLFYQIIYWNFVWEKDRLRISLLLEKLAIFVQIGRKILRAYEYIRSKNFSDKVPKRAILTIKWRYARGLVNNEFYDELEEKWLHSNDHPVALLRQENKERIPWIIQKIKNHFEKKCVILDIGCGAGFLCNALAKEGHRVSGIDLSETSLELAKRKDETGNVTYLKADGYDPPFKEKSFDVISAMDFLEHVDQPEKIVAKAASLLKPDGLFFFHTFNRNIISYLTVIKGVEWFVKNTPKNMHVYNLFIKPEELKDMLTHNSLNPIEMVGFSPKVNFSLLKMALTRKVPLNLSFKIHDSLRTGYLGFAKKVCENSH